MGIDFRTIFLAFLFFGFVTSCGSDSDDLKKPEEATCRDGIQNSDEVGIDCGGATCRACTTCIDQDADGYGVGPGRASCPICQAENKCEEDPNDDDNQIVPSELLISITESFEIEFPFDSDSLCPPGQDCTVTPAPSPGPIDLPDVQIPIPVDLLASIGSTELNQIADRVEKVEIESVEYELIDNTLNIDSPVFNVYVGPSNATQITGTGTVQLITIPSVPSMESKKGVAQPNPQIITEASDLLKSLNFTAIGYSNKDIEKGDLFPVQGKALYKLKFNLRFTVDPAD